MLLIDFVLLIQFILIINLILLRIDFILLIQLMLALKGHGLRSKWPRTEARRAEDRGPPGTVGRGIIGERAASPLATSYSVGSALSSVSGSGAEPRQPNCFPAPKATLNCRKKVPRRME